MKNLLPVYYQIKETVKNWILDKEYHPGQRIPSVEKPAKHFKVSQFKKGEKSDCRCTRTLHAGAARA